MAIRTLLLALLIPIVSYSQDTVNLRYKAFKVLYSKSRRNPVKVEWWLTRKMVSCNTKVEREDSFRPDLRLVSFTNVSEDYVNSGYDRGHMFPAADGRCNLAIMQECFLFTNIAPQTPQLNRGDWKTVEELSRLEASKADSVYIWAGSVGEVKKIGSVSVPDKFWKVIYVKKTKEYFAFLFNNNTSKPNGINDNKTTVKNIESLTGFKFTIK